MRLFPAFEYVISKPIPLPHKLNNEENIYMIVMDLEGKSRMGVDDIYLPLIRAPRKVSVEACHLRQYYGYV